MSEFKVIDNTQKVLKEFQKQITVACKAVGEKAVSYAKGDTPVDTGRLRNSITYTTMGYGGSDTYSNKAGEVFTGGSAFGGGSSSRTIYIGTNVQYAKYVEFIERYHHKTGKAHYLRDAAANHADEYRDIFKTALKG